MIKNRFISSLFITVLFAAITLGIFRKTFYYPLSVCVEIKCDTLSNVQLFYAGSEIFSESGKQHDLYSDTGDFQLLTFGLPAKEIRKIRIDPATDSIQFSLRNIIICNGMDSLIFRGSEIPGHFTMIGLIPVDSIRTTEILTLKSTGTDPNLTLREDLQSVFVLKNTTKTAFFRILSSLIILIIWIILLRKTPVIFSRIKGSMRVTGHSFFHFLKGNDRTFTLWIIGLVVFRYFLISVQPMSFITYTLHDDAWFINTAFSLGNGDWLGAYSNMTLIHGTFYPAFIATINFLGISLPLAQYLLLVFSALVLVLAVSPLIKSRPWQIVLFCLILFNPMNSIQTLTRVLREGIYSSLGILVFGTFIGMILSRDRSLRSLFRWSMFASVALFFLWNTREEGIITLPSLIWFSAWGILLVNLKSGNETGEKLFPGSKNVRLKKTFLFLMPFFVLISGNALIATMNYVYYGGFMINELKTGAFPAANIALTKIADAENKLMVPVTRKMMHKAFEVSPAFRQLRASLDRDDNPFMKYGPGYPGEYAGGWFFWAFREAAQQAGHHQTLTRSQEYYRTVANEINQAFDNGTLQKKELIPLFSFSWDPRITLPFLNKFREGLIYAITFKGYFPYPLFTNNDPEQVARFQNITLTHSNLSKDPAINQTPANRLKYKALTAIATYTAMISAPVFALSVLCLIFLTILLLLSHRHKPDHWVPWAIITGFLTMIVARTGLIAFLAVTQHNATGPHYLNFVYPFLLVFSFFSIYFAFGMLMKMIRPEKKNEI